MDISNPPRRPTWGTGLRTFALAAFVVSLWSIVIVLREVPAWVLRLNLWDVAGVVAYTQALALMEALLVAGGLLLLRACLPARWRGEAFVPLALGLLLVSGLWVAGFHLLEGRLTDRLTVLIAGLAVGYAGSVGILLVALRKAGAVVRALEAAAERLVILGGLYAVVGVASLAVVLVRNLLWTT